MSRESFEAHLDTARLARLADLVTLGDPVWTDDLDIPAVRARLADVEVMLTSWGGCLYVFRQAVRGVLGS
ncbi:hypothetical protein ACWEQU_19890 [Streptomyces nodosus]